MTSKRGGQKNPTFSTVVIFGFVARPQGENPFTVRGNLNNNKYQMKRCQKCQNIISYVTITIHCLK